jgi:hypothetical protein
MNDLVEWLRAQLDALEFSDWHERTCRIHKRIASSSPILAGQPLSCLCPVPEFLLREVEAKRRIIDWALDDEGEYGLARANGTIDGEYSIDLELPDRLLRLLALPFSDRPGYREEWRP